MKKKQELEQNGYLRTISVNNIKLTARMDMNPSFGLDDLALSKEIGLFYIVCCVG